MRHRMRGRKLGRNSSHRKAMFRNMACSLIRSVRVDEDDDQSPLVPGRVVTTVSKAKELRPFVERLVTIAKDARKHEDAAAPLASSADRNSAEWKQWRESSSWNEWNQTIAPAVTARRRAFSMLRDKAAVDILFDELAERFADRAGGYTRVVRLAEVRLGDAGRKALIEFVGERDRKKVLAKAPVVSDTDDSTDDEEESTEASDEESAEVTAEAEQNDESDQDDGESETEKQSD